MLAYYSKNCKGGSIVIDVPAFVMSCSLVRPGALLSTRRIPAAPPHSQKTPVSPGAGHGQGPLPRDREDSIGMPFARFQRTLAVLPQGSITRRCSPFRCFRLVFSVRGSRRGSTGDFRSPRHTSHPNMTFRPESLTVPVLSRFAKWPCNPPVAVLYFHRN